MSLGRALVVPLGLSLLLASGCGSSSEDFSASSGQLPSQGSSTGGGAGTGSGGSGSSGGGSSHGAAGGDVAGVGTSGGTVDGGTADAGGNDGGNIDGGNTDGGNTDGDTGLPPGRPSQGGIAMVNVDEAMLALGKADNLSVTASLLSGNGRYLLLVVNEMGAASEGIFDPVFPATTSGYLVKFDLVEGTRKVIPLTALQSDRPGSFLLDSLVELDVTEDGRYVAYTDLLFSRHLEGDDPSSADQTGATYLIDTVEGSVLPINTFPDGSPLKPSGPVAFLGSSRRLLVPVDRSLYIRDLDAGTMEVVDGSQAFSFFSTGRRKASQDGNRFLVMAEDDQQQVELAVHDLSTSSTTIITDGEELAADFGRYSLSADGHSVVFVARLANPETSEQANELYLYHVNLRDSTRTLLATGRPDNPFPLLMELGISPDGSQVAYTRLFDAEGNLAPRLVLVELTGEGTSTEVSQLIPDPAFRPGTSDPPTFPSFSNDGRTLSFTWYGANQNYFSGVYLYDLASGQLRDVVAEFGLFASSQVRSFASSSDGTKVVFDTDEILKAADRAHSRANDEAFGSFQTYLVDLLATTIRELSVLPDGSRYARKFADAYLAPSPGAPLHLGADTSDDGQHSVFSSGLALGFTPEEVQDKAISNVFLNLPGQPGPLWVSRSLEKGDYVLGLSISGDGRTVAYSSRRGLFLYDVVTGDETLIFEQPLQGSGTFSASLFTDLDLSYDGRVLTYVDTNVTRERFELDIFVSRALKRVDLANLIPHTIHQTFDPSDFQGGPAQISNDGRYVALSSNAALLPQDTNSAHDVYRYDVLGGTFELVSRRADGSVSSAGAAYPSMSGDARFVTFSSIDTAFSNPAAEPGRHVFVRDMTNSVNAWVSISRVEGAQPSSNDLSYLSRNGRRILFRSFGRGVVGQANAHASNLFTVRNPFATP